MTLSDIQGDIPLVCSKLLNSRDLQKISGSNFPVLSRALTEEGLQAEQY